MSVISNFFECKKKIDKINFDLLINGTVNTYTNFFFTKTINRNCTYFSFKTLCKKSQRMTFAVQWYLFYHRIELCAENLITSSLLVTYIYKYIYLLNLVKKILIKSKGVFLSFYFIHH